MPSSFFEKIKAQIAAKFGCKVKPNVSIVGTPGPCPNPVLLDSMGDPYMPVFTPPLNMDNPRFTHDCKRCTFLGQFGEFDLYYCDQWSRIPTVVARYGNEPWEYASGLEATSIPELAEAKRRAEERGLSTKFGGKI